MPCRCPLPSLPFLGQTMSTLKGDCMAIIDQHRTWEKVQERLGTETDPILRRNLEVVLKHLKTEAVVDLEPLMSTIAEDSRYQNFAKGGTGPVGKAEVREFYEALARTVART